MKSRPLRFALPLSILVTIPFIYNSCQGGLLGGKGFASYNPMGACKTMLERGQVAKLETPSPEAAPPLFTEKKVLLREPGTPGAAQAKTEGPVTVNAGTRLAVIMDNRCLQENREALGNTVISKEVAAAGNLLADLDRQVYGWELTRDYTDTEIEQFADQEACVVGLSWSRNYKVQASFNDTGIFEQQHLNSIRAQQSYDYFFNSGAGMSVSGKPVIIAVVDTGVDWQHPDIQANMWTNANGWGIDITTWNGVRDYNPYDNSSIGHGTHVAGLIAAVSNNSMGVIGAMPYRAKIMAIKVFDAQGNTTSEHFANALRYAWQNGAKVINLSLGAVGAGASSDPVAESAVTEAVANGTFVTVVIGNAEGSANGQLVDGSSYSSIPGQYSIKPGVVGVGSFDIKSGDKSYFSHYSTTYAEIGAPGADLGSTGIYSTKPTALSSYGRLAGTSQAGPQVSAAAGLAIGLIYESYQIYPSPREVEDLLLTSAAKSTKLAPYFKNGNRLDLVNLAIEIMRRYPGTNGGAIDLASLRCR